LVNFSNLLIAGCAGAIKQACNVPILVTLQGDDIFLDGLIEPHKSQAFAEIRRITEHVDGYLTFSRFYADFMADYLSLPRERIHLVPLGISSDGFTTARPRPCHRPPTVGYLARVCPAKGFDVLTEAFLRLSAMPGMESARLRAAGWLGPADEAYFAQQRDRLVAAGLGARFEYVGTVDRSTKIAFLEDLDVFSVPTRYREPKGLYVLESLAAGVPVVQPAHGAFPELLAATAGGVLTPPEDPEQLAVAWYRLLTNEAERSALGAAGRARVATDFTATAMARATLEVYRQYLGAAGH
jgi:glycosyltransferase involved in cell wall biosynthesis